jgi:hypothetical protein
MPLLGRPSGATLAILVTPPGLITGWAQAAREKRRKTTMGFKDPPEPTYSSENIISEDRRISKMRARLKS